jgi:DNA-binding beta-propeller fold protein YncE
MIKYLLILLFSTLVSSEPTNKPSAYSVANQYVKKINLRTLKSKSTSIQIPILNKRMASFSIKNKSTYLNGDFSFESKSSDSKGHISATMGKNSIFGQMHYGNKHYILTTEKSGSWIIELPESGMTYNSCGIKDHNHPQIQNKPSLKTVSKKGSGDYTIIDLLFVYNQALADRYPGELLQTRLNQYLYVANQSNENSKVDLKLRNVATEQIAYDLNNDNLIALNDMNASLQGNTVAGMENLKQLREANGADIVVFFRLYDIETSGSCGIAFFPTSDDTGEFDPSYGAHMVSDGMSSWSICTDEVLIHELGHNLGASHHNAPRGLRFREQAAGFAKQGQFTTIMGSFGTGQPERFYEINMFSNPNLQCGGESCGSFEDFDNSSVIKSMKSTLAEYQAEQTTVPIPETLVKIDADHDGDGFADSVDAFPFDPLQHSDADKDGVSDENDAFPNDATEQFDIDLDGIGNNQDEDPDGDGFFGVGEFGNTLDWFPLDPNEHKDSDRDGIGDNQDAFPLDRQEQVEPLDFDNDGITDLEDTDDDNDGFIDLSTKQDLLVISVGNNQVLRFDALTGESKGIEIVSDDGVLTFQSDLNYRPYDQHLFYGSASTVKQHDLNNRISLGVSIPSYSKPTNQTHFPVELGSGFPTAIDNWAESLDTFFDDRKAIVVYTMNRSCSFGYTILNVMASFFFDEGCFSFSPSNSNLIDSSITQGYVYLLDNFNKAIYKYDTSKRDNLVLFENLLNDPYAIAISDNLSNLYVSNQESDDVIIIDKNTGELISIKADLGAKGYSNPTGIVVTNEEVLLVAASDQNAILKFNAATGEFLGELVSGQGLDQPHKMILVPQLHDRFPNDANKVIRPNAGLWYNRATSGRGFDIEVFNNRLSVIWYTYDETGLPIWYISSGELVGFEYTGVFNKTHLNPDETFSLEEVGSITINFENERKAQVQWQLNENSGSEPISWLTWSTQETLDETNYTGLWGRPDGPGWGVSIATIGSISIAIPYLYDVAGEPRWLISDPVTTSSPLNFSMNAIFSKTLCPSCSGISEYTSQSSGTMLMDIDENKTWSSEISYPSPLNGEWNLTNTELRLFSSDATRPR